MNIYERLGVKRIINASDTYTKIGGSRMTQRTLQVMAEAANWFVDIKELQQKASAEIAAMTKNEGAFITSGAAGGMVLTAASLMTYDNPQAMKSLPQTDMLPRNEFIIFAGQCIDVNPYWHLINLSGGRLIKVGPSVKAMVGAITPKTAGIYYFAGTLYEENVPDVEDVIAAAKKHRIPVVIDAAAQLPPVENLWYYTRELGADLAVFSGGKFIMGPQPTGLILGRKDLIGFCEDNSAPNVMIGRPFKVGKEEIAAILTAVESFVQDDPLARERVFLEILKIVADEISSISAIGITITNRGRLGQHIPMLVIQIPQGMKAVDCHQYLYSGDPAIDIGYYEGGNEGIVFVNPINLRIDEARIVAARLKAYFLRDY